jgi:hypothetical protein
MTPLFHHLPSANIPANRECMMAFPKDSLPVQSSISSIKPSRMHNSALKIIMANADVQMKKACFLSSQWLAERRTTCRMENNAGKYTDVNAYMYLRFKN